MARRRSLPIITVSVVMVGGLVACSGGSTDSRSSATAPPAKGPVTLKLLEYQKPRADAVEKLLPEFEAAMKQKGRDIKVTLIRNILPDDQFKTQITQQYNAGEAPDVTDYGATFVPGLAGAGYLLDLTPYLKSWPEWQTFYPDVRQQIVQPDGKIYALPHEANTQSLFYRKDVLEKLGVSTAQPATWPELISRLSQVTAKTGQPSIVLPAGTAWGGGTFGEGFLNVMLGTSSKLYNTETKKWVVKSPGLTSTFNHYAELTKAKLLPVSALLNPEPWQPTKYKAFPAGTLPVAAQGTWGWRYDWGPEGSAPIPGLLQKVATWDYPADSGTPYSVSSVAFSYEVTAKTKTPAEAVELVKWLSSGRAMAEQLVAVGAAAPRTGIDKLAPYSTQAPLIATGKQLASGSSKSFPPRPGQDQISQAVGAATEGILTGKMDGAAAAEYFAKNATDLLGADQVETAAS
jgi:multiple sugar transport system substrate-binding protein